MNVPDSIPKNKVELDMIVIATFFRAARYHITKQAGLALFLYLFYLYFKDAHTGCHMWKLCHQKFRDIIQFFGIEGRILDATDV